MWNAAVAEVLHDETSVFEGVDAVPEVYPAHLGHLGPLVLVVGGAVSLTDEQVVVVLRSDKPERSNIRNQLI